MEKTRKGNGKIGNDGERRWGKATQWGKLTRRGKGKGDGEKGVYGERGQIKGKGDGEKGKDGKKTRKDDPVGKSDTTEKM